MIETHRLKNVVIFLQKVNDLLQILDFSVELKVIFYMLDFN